VLGPRLEADQRGCGDEQVVPVTKAAPDKPRGGAKGKRGEGTDKCRG
jgi:hypothetical protein